MNIQQMIRLACLVVVIAVVGIVINEMAITTSSQNATTDVTTANGLTVVTFVTDAAWITINAPDDTMAGDTISGTVFAEVKGDSAEDRAKNLDMLKALVVVIGNRTLEPFSVICKEKDPDPCPVTFFLYHTDGKKLELPVILKTREDNEVARTIIPVYPNMGTLTPPPGSAPSKSVYQRTELNAPRPATNVPTHPSGAVITPGPPAPQNFIVPGLGQAGRTFAIRGPFDGNASNTKLGWTSVPPASGSDSGSMTAPLPLLAESPRKVVFIAPANVTGPIEIRLKERETETKSVFRNLGVRLSAPKTSLMRGETTTVTVRVAGLQGITDSVPLQLVKGGVVTMEGGDRQTMTINPSDVKGDGTFTTTRTITGQQAGTFSLVASVVVFDICLHDDDNGNSLKLSSNTGRYIFCPGNIIGNLVNNAGANKPNSATSDLTIDYSSDGTITRDDQGKFSLQGITGLLIQTSLGKEWGTGKATITDSKLKKTFTITDRDTRTNTCSCK